MAFRINFSRHMVPNYSQRCCKILQNPQFRNFKALLQGKECVSFVVPIHSRDCSTRLAEDTKHIQLIRAKFKNLHKELKDINDLWNNAKEDGKLHLDKVKGDRLSFEAHDGSPKKIDHTFECSETYIGIRSSVMTADHPLPSFNRKAFRLNIYIDERWENILQQTGNPRVNRLIELLDANEIRTHHFCLAMGLLFDESTNENYDDVPPLTEFEPDEIKFAVQPIFDYDYYYGNDFWKVECLNSDSAHKCVTHVLLKPLTEFST